MASRSFSFPAGANRMIDQDAVTARVVARLAAEGRRLLDLTVDEQFVAVDAAVRALVAESPAYPRELGKVQPK